MKTVQIIRIVLPFFILFSLIGLLYKELFYSKPGELPSALIGEKLPEFQLPDLTDHDKQLTQKSLSGHVTLLNIWATWCYACGLEHNMLMKIKDEYHVPVYSIDYKDDPVTARIWLTEHGNPFVMTGTDVKGNVAIDLGVYGTPETFIISKTGKILYRHVGAIDQKNWDEVLYPLIRKFENA